MPPIASRPGRSEPRPGPAPAPLGTDDLPPTGPLPGVGLPGASASDQPPVSVPPVSVPPVSVPPSSQPPRSVPPVGRPAVETPAGMPQPEQPAEATDDLGAPPGGPGASPQDPAPAIPPTDPVPSPADPVPSPTDPVPSPADPVPSPGDPVPSPGDPVPSPGDPVPSPADPVPSPADPVPSPAQPVPSPAQPVPSAGEVADPWLPSGAAPAKPAPTKPAPTKPAPTKPAPTKPAPDGAGEAEDPWLPGGAALSNPTASDEPKPASDEPKPAADEPKPARDEPEDPWLPGGAGTTTPPADPAVPAPGETAPVVAEGYVSSDRARRAMEQVTRLLDRPGAKDISGYPDVIVRADDAGMALTPGTKPVLIVFYDDGVRASDLQAAQLLPMIVRLRELINFVPLDRGTGSKRSRGADELALRYLDHVPTIVVLDAQRTVRLQRSGRVDAARVERAIREALANPTAPSPADPARGAAAPTPGHAVPASPGDEPPVDPFAGPKDGAEPKDTPTDTRRGTTFSPPADYSARTHAERLRSAPGEASVPGYPDHLLPSVPAARILGTGSKPGVILFYDNASKASDLQAAAYIELLVRRKSEIDLVLIDVGVQGRWDADQKRVVRTYYNFFVPTTVVLTAGRAPVKAWYSRVEATALNRAIDQALAR